ncbi:unnamed protein product [Trichobilharzia szidati]|nr:unnamed protein product [Trichobilharzia szidati]
MMDTYSVCGEDEDLIDREFPPCTVNDHDSLTKSDEQKLRIFDLEKAIEAKLRERNNLREKLRLLTRQSERLDALFSLKLESKERELRHFLLPCVPRSSTCDTDANKQNITTNSTISSTVRPVPTLVTGLTKPLDSLLGPTVTVTRAVNPKGGGLLPTPFPNPLHVGNKLAAYTRGLPLSSHHPQSSKSTMDNELSTKEIPSYTNVLVDSSVNLILTRLLRVQRNFNNLVATNQSKLQSFTFTQNSQNGKRMMMRIRVLEHENEELANVNRAGRTARLETEIALRRAFVNDLKNAHSDMEYLVEEAESETEFVGNSLIMMQQRLQLGRTTVGFLAAELGKIEPECCARILASAGNTNDNNTSIENKKHDNSNPVLQQQPYSSSQNENLYDDELNLSSEVEISLPSSDSPFSERTELRSSSPPPDNGESDLNATETVCDEKEALNRKQTIHKSEREISEDPYSSTKSKRSRISGNYDVSSDGKSTRHLDSLSFLHTKLPRSNTSVSGTERNSTHPTVPVREPQRTLHSNCEHTARINQTKSNSSSSTTVVECVPTELLRLSNCNSQLAVVVPSGKSCIKSFTSNPTNGSST